ncbi:zinc/iron-chelating domain-containing protein [Helicobacter sp. CLO-3]|uniref:YkgJ family cysteine cluster protein n=1 Tax=unclassified Helicobacter TaxID=2593540 RepID=UPI000805F231|nr:MULTISPECIES: YkgJ family cysteine cluster protein [unclassified Helicobacter]OBV28588.1 flagellin N-methylase [Helicobacter sp. CLO-3]OHU81036.1 zinc/iron-chelating domain-containing protein [Helicobacter sp. CLO-3]
MGFPCSVCGICCKNIGGIKELEAFDLGNGVCKYLDSANRCMIYSTRPDICNVKTMYEKLYHRHYSKEEFYALNLKSCEILQAQAKKA